MLPFTYIFLDSVPLYTLRRNLPILAFSQQKNLVGQKKIAALYRHQMAMGRNKDNGSCGLFCVAALQQMPNCCADFCVV